MKLLNLCLLQMDLAWESPEENYKRAEALLEGLEKEPDLIILPEMFSTGFTMWPEGNEEAMDGPSIQWMQDLARRKKALVMGSLIIKVGGNFYNRLLVLSESGIVYQYDKRHLFRMAGEHERYTGGEETGTFMYKGWRICPLVCYDLRFPVWSRNRLGEGGNPAYDLLIYVANWPERRAPHWKLLLQARAVENQTYLVGLNRVGEDGNKITYSGDSMVVDPLGKILVTSSYETKALEATLEMDHLEKYRESFPAWQDADDFSIR